MDDIRLKFGFLDHPKIRKLKRYLGSDAVLSLLYLYFFTAENKPKGILDNMDHEDIEIAARWEGEPGLWIQRCLDIRLLDCDGDWCQIHDWEEHNRFAFFSPERKEQAREAGIASGKARKANGQSTTSQQNVERSVNGLRTPSPTPTHLSTPLSTVQKGAASPTSYEEKLNSKLRGAKETWPKVYAFYGKYKQEFHPAVFLHILDRLKEENLNGDPWPWAKKILDEDGPKINAAQYKIEQNDKYRETNDPKNIGHVLAEVQEKKNQRI